MAALGSINSAITSHSSLPEVQALLQEGWLLPLCESLLLHQVPSSSSSSSSSSHRTKRPLASLHPLSPPHPLSLPPLSSDDSSGVTSSDFTSSDVEQTTCSPHPVPVRLEALKVLTSLCRESSVLLRWCGVVWCGVVWCGVV